MEGVHKRKGAYLPHWTREQASYFVTFRTQDSLPRDVVLRFREEIRITERALERRLRRELTELERSECRWKVAGRIEAYLDNAHGECLLRKPQLAALVRDALKHFDGEKFRLDAWCVMPNHVHVVVTPFEGHSLPSILLSWKTFSAKRVNEQAGRRGRFWQREYYDRLIRNEVAYEGIVRYVLNNPVKAGLRDWPFVGRHCIAEREVIA